MIVYFKICLHFFLFVCIIIYIILVYKIGLRPEFPTVTNNLSSEHNYTTSLKNYNAPTNDEPLFVTDSTTVLLSGVSNLALNGNITIFKIPLLKYSFLFFPLSLMPLLLKSRRSEQTSSASNTWWHRWKEGIRKRRIAFWEIRIFQKQRTHR